jgi:hypothetical protein
MFSKHNQNKTKIIARMSENFNLVSNWCRLCGSFDAVLKPDPDYELLLDGLGVFKVKIVR